MATKSMQASARPSPKKKCFFATPIGEPNSPSRLRSDALLKHLIRPVCRALGYAVERADEMDEPGLITVKIVKRLIEADLVIADLCSYNPNVFYELAVRHLMARPVVHVIDEGAKIPFDVFDFCSIHVNHDAPHSVKTAKGKLKKHILSAERLQTIDNAIVVALQTAGIELPPGMLALVRRPPSTSVDQDATGQSQFFEGSGDATSDTATPSVVARSLSGLWDSNEGLVRLIQQGDNVFGEFQHDGSEWVGDVIGRIVGDRVVYQWRWKDDPTKALGFWRILPDSLEGRYIFDFDHAAGSYDEALAIPALLEAKTAGADEWNLSRFIAPLVAGSAPRFEMLTPRDLRVMQRLCHGLLAKQIARELGATTKAVKAHAARVMKKLGVASVEELRRVSQLSRGSVSSRR